MLYKGLTNGISNAQLIEIARKYIIENPSSVYLNDKQISIMDSDLIKTGFNVEWFGTHAPEGVRYYSINEYKTPYDYLNGKYSVYWRYIQGREKNGSNWFNRDGLQCVGGYGVNVLISDLNGQAIQANQLRTSQLKGSIRSIPALL